MMGFARRPGQRTLFGTSARRGWSPFTSGITGAESATPPHVAPRPCATCTIDSTHVVTVVLAPSHAVPLPWQVPPWEATCVQVSGNR